MSIFEKNFASFGRSNSRAARDLRNVRRAAEIVAAFGGELLHLDRAAPVNVRRACEKLGVTFIKMAQVVSSTYGLFPERFVLELRRCLDRVPPLSWDEASAVVERAYGKPISAVFQRFDRAPIASASIAQVHAATLRDGRSVAVKVKRPGIEGRIEQDLAVARLLVGAIQPRSEWAATVNLSGIVDEFEQAVRHELDFRGEASFMERYRKRVAEVDPEHIFVPPVVSELSNADVLVMEYVDGVPLTEIKGENGLDGYDLLARLLRVWCEIILRYGDYHGDLHAGNILFVRPNKLALVDFGVVGVLNEKRRRALFDLLVFTLLDDDVLLGRHFKQMGFAPEDADDGEIKKRLRAILDKGKQKQNFDIRFEDMFPDVIAYARELGCSVPRDIMLLSRQQIYLAAHCRRLAPGRDVLKHPCMSELLFPKPRKTMIPAPVSHPRYRLAMPDDVPSARLLSCPICCTVVESDVDYIAGEQLMCWACFTLLTVVQDQAQSLAMAPAVL